MLFASASEPLERGKLRPRVIGKYCWFPMLDSWYMAGLRLIGSPVSVVESHPRSERCEAASFRSQCVPSWARHVQILGIVLPIAFTSDTLALDGQSSSEGGKVFSGRANVRPRTSASLGRRGLCRTSPSIVCPKTRRSRR